MSHYDVDINLKTDSLETARKLGWFVSPKILPTIWQTECPNCKKTVSFEDHQVPRVDGCFRDWNPLELLAKYHICENHVQTLHKITL